MTPKRKRYTPQFKTQAVLELLEDDSTLSEVSSKFDINPTMLSGWRKQFLENACHFRLSPAKFTPADLSGCTLTQQVTTSTILFLTPANPCSTAKKSY